MTSSAAHITDLQEILEAAKEAAKSNPTSANIAAVGKARKALEEYQSSSEEPERFKTQAAALEYLQLTYRIEKSKLSKDVNDGKVPRKDGFYHAKDLDYYAQANRLDLKNSEPIQGNEAKSRLTMAMAQERELKLSALRGELINAAEEEARDAKLWSAIKTDITNHATAIVHELINLALPVMSIDEERQQLLSLSHQLRVVYEDAIDDIFDRYSDIEGEE